MNPLEQIEQVERRVSSTERDGAATKRVILRRSYPAELADVWDALTSAERLPRWFLPVTGDLRLGGRYQFEGNAGGTIEVCRPRELIKATWEYDGETSWVEVRLDTESNGRTMIEIVHEGPVNDHWRHYGPGRRRSRLGPRPGRAGRAPGDRRDRRRGGVDDHRRRPRRPAPGQRGVGPGGDPRRRGSPGGQGSSAARTAAAYTGAPEPTA